jgi:hypothetical protein
LRTGIIAEAIQQRLGCYAIINDRYFKPKGEIKKDAANYFLDLFRVDHSRKVPEYIERIEAVVKSSGRTIVLWVHGISDDFAAAQGEDHVALGLLPENAMPLHALIGYGQGGDSKTGVAEDLLSARPETVEAFRNQLTKGGLTTIPTHRESGNYRGRDSKRFNQWFVQTGYAIDQVESIQLEIRELGFRDTGKNALKTARIIAHALSVLTRS